MTNEVFIVSVVASTIATVVVIIIQRFWSGIQSSKNFKKFEGKYSGFSYKKQDPQSGEYNEYLANNAIAIITYVSRNKLKIESTWENQTWEGFIYMKNNNVGDLTWKYVQENPIIIGSKEISFWESGPIKIVYLNERFDKKYGRELLIKRDDDEN